LSVLVKEEFERSICFLKANISDSSAWAYREFLLRAFCCEDTAQHVVSELAMIDEWILAAALTFSGSIACLWIYRRFVMRLVASLDKRHLADQIQSFEAAGSSSKCQRHLEHLRWMKTLI